MNPLKEFFSKYRKKLLVPISVVLAVVILINFFFVFEITPQPNDECLWEIRPVYKDSLGIFFIDVKFEGVTWNAGIRDGDQLIAIDGKRIQSLQAATQELNKVSSGDSANYTVARNGRIFNTNVEVKKLIHFGGLALALISGIWLLVSILVISAKPDGLTQILFYRIAVTLTFFSSSTLLLTRNIINPIYELPWLVILLDLLWTFGGAFLPFLIVHFFWLFPKPLKIVNNKWIIRSLYIAPVVIFILSVLFRLLFLYTGVVNPIVFYQIYPITNSFLIFLGAVIGLISLFLNYIRLQTKHERNAIFFILIAYAIGIASIIYTIILESAGERVLIFNSPEYFMPIILISLIPVAFGFSIFRYSLMDVSHVVKNTILYGAATVTIAAAYFFVIYVIGQSLSQAIGTEYQGLVAGLIFILFALVFQSTKDKFQELITRKFYPEQFAYQKVILRFNNDIATIVGMENILKTTCKTFVEALKLNHFGIALRNKKFQKSFDVIENVGFQQNHLGFEVDIAKLAEFILVKRDANLPVVIDENDFTELFKNDSHRLKNENVYTIIPLIIKSKIIGFLLFGLKHSGSKFAGMDLELLSAAANQVAVALENARLYETEAEKLKIERDLENARKIQLSLLPEHVPYFKELDISGTMIPAMQVGGDYYDFIKVSGSKLFVVIGDVSGKGLSASFYMSKLQTMIQMYCTESVTPKDVLIEVNRRMYDTIEKNWFITMSIALFDIRNKTVKFCRAGHTPMIISRNGDLTFIKPNGLGIGLEYGDVFERTIEEIELPLNSQVLFTMFSDGVNETMNAANDFYGMDRLCSNLKNTERRSSSEIMNNILTSLRTFREDAEQSDDITLVLVKTAAA